MVKETRAALAKEAGYSQMRTEPRLSTISQRRGDVFFVDDTKHKHFHYMSDDVIVHPLCRTHIRSELANPLASMEEAEKKKKATYEQPLAMLRSAQACVAGLRKVVFLACAFTSLGALGKGSKQFVNSAAGFMKHRAADLQKRRPRDDGLTPQQLTKRFRFKARAMLQAAILRVNGLLAASVGV